MAEEPKARVYPRGVEGEFPDGPPTVEIQHRGFKLLLRFAEDDFRGEGSLQKLELLPDEEELQLRVLRRFAPDAERYLRYAQAQMRLFGPEGTPEQRIAEIHDSAEVLRTLGGPGRRIPDKFFHTLLVEYDELVSAGEQAPVAALARMYQVVPSAASKWLKRARALADEEVDYAR